MLSSTIQQGIQEEIDKANPFERTMMRDDAEQQLKRLQIETGYGVHMSPQHDRLLEVAVEVLVRLEATEKGKGFWFRGTRRLQLCKQWFGR